MGYPLSMSVSVVDRAGPTYLLFIENRARDVRMTTSTCMWSYHMYEIMV